MRKRFWLVGLGLISIFIVSIGARLMTTPQNQLHQIAGLSAGAGFEGLDPQISKPVKAPMGAPHVYSLTLEKGQYLLVYVRQLDADVSLALRGPSGEVLLEQDSYNGDVGLEMLPWLARESGEYRVEVGNSSRHAGGAYTLVASKPRQPTSYDLETIQFFKDAPGLLQIAAEESLERQALSFEKVKAMALVLGEPEWASLLDREHAAQLREVSAWGAAVDAYRRAFAGYQNLEVPWREAMLGRIAQDLGTVLLRQGAYEEAIRWNVEALKRRAAPDLKRAESLMEQSFVHGDTGAYQEGQAYLAEVESILTQHDDLAMKQKMLILKGSFQNAENKPILAVEMYKKARAVPIALDLQQEVTLLDRESKAFFSLGRYEEALEALLKARKLVGEDRQRWLAVLACNITEVLIAMERYEEAEKVIAEAEHYFSDKVEPATQAFLWFQKAKLALAGTNKAEALRCMRSCLQLSEQIRGHSESLSLKATYSAAHYEYQDFLVEVLMGYGLEEDAFRAVEQVRARNLVQRLRSPKSERFFDTDLDKLKKQISEMAWQLSNLETSNPRDRQALNVLLWRFSRMRDQSGEVAGQPSDENPHTPLDFETVQKMLDAKTTVFYYAMGSNRVWLWTIDQEGIESFELGARESLESDALNFFQAVRNRDPGPHRGRIGVFGKRLADQLFPANALPEPDTRLVFVADGNLHYLPFSALPLPQDTHRPLVTEYEMVHLHSLSVLAVLRARQKISQGWRKAAVFAAPIYHSNSQYKPLPYSLKEAELVQQYGGEKVALFTGELASKNQFLQMTQKYDLLHIAVHGLSLPQQGDLSALVLSNVSPSGASQDGYLRGHEIAATPIGAKLVVLSSCRSALGQHLRGEGLVGLPQSFLEAGALSVIAGLWDLEDQTTAELMGHFYRNLYQEGLAPSAALRLAQIRMWETPGYEDPYSWAAFQFQGDWR